MQLREMPVSTQIAIVRDRREILDALDQVFGANYSGSMYMENVQGAVRTTRVLTVEGCPGSMSVPHGPIGIPDQLLLLDSEAKRSPQPGPGAAKAWEVSICFVNSNPAAIVAATWQ